MDFPHPEILTLAAWGWSRPDRLWTQSHKTIPLHCRHQLQRVGLDFHLMWLQTRGPRDPLLGCELITRQLTELRETLMFTSLLYEEGYVKRYSQKNSKKKRQGRSGRVTRTTASAPVGLGCASLPVHGSVHRPGSAPNHILWGFSWKLHQIGTMGHEVALQPLSPSWRTAGGAENSRLPITAQSF